MAQTKMTAQAAAAKAIRNCRGSEEKNQQTAAYLARQYLLSSGHTATEAAALMADVQKELDSLFEKRDSGASASQSTAAKEE